MLKTVHKDTGSEEAPRSRRRNDQAIRYYCVAHRSPSAERSPLTIYLGSWAYCPQGYGPVHEWVAIEPISYEDLLSFRPTFLTAQRARELAPA